MTLERLRYIGGFGAMGWLDGAELDLLPPLAASDEDALIAEFGRRLAGAGGVELLGVDRYGADLKRDGVRHRCVFDGTGSDIETLHAALESCIERRAD
jgi:heme iron utilization protein